MHTFIVVVIVLIFIGDIANLISAYKEEQWGELIMSFSWFVVLCFFAKYIGILFDMAGV